MAKIDGDELAKLVMEFGEPEQANKLRPEQAENYRGSVPDPLIDFWITHGRGAYQKGKFWITDPELFQPVVEYIFEGDPEFSPSELFTFQRGAFAELAIWSSSRKCIIELSMNLEIFTVNNLDSWMNISTGSAYQIDQIVGAIIYRNKYLNAWVDDNDQDMLDEAIQRCGPLFHDEIYGFFPAFQLGGQNIIENVRKVKAVEHLLFLAQIADFKLQKFIMPDTQGNGGGYEFIRYIGR